ncbi:MAG: hypothetical protein HQM15_10130 [Deltaproteobacteria bacterium]|nr:hypothetical protein [Deltaproteobacteria bacterium]
MDKTSSPVVKPYQFEGLTKLSSRDLQIEEALLSYLPFQLDELPIKRAVEEFLSQQFREEAKISLERIEESNLRKIMQALPEFCVLGQLSVQPLEGKAFALFDYTFIFGLIHRLLGAKGEVPIEMRNLSVLEEGVLEFLILKVLSLFYNANNQDTSLQFRFEALHQGTKKLAAFQRQETAVALVHLRIQVGGQSGYLLIALPHPLVEGLFLKTRHYSEDWLLQWNKRCLKRLSEMDYIKTQVLAEIGSVTLTIAEKNQLERGDVILFDQTFCHFSDEILSGNVVVKVGENANQGFLAQVVSAESPVLVKVIDYYGGNHG